MFDLSVLCAHITTPNYITHVAYVLFPFHQIIHPPTVSQPPLVRKQFFNSFLSLTPESRITADWKESYPLPLAKDEVDVSTIRCCFVPVNLRRGWNGREQKFRLIVTIYNWSMNICLILWNFKLYLVLIFNIFLLL